MTTAPVALVYAAFMDPNGDDDPVDKGYIQPDQFLPTEEGGGLDGGTLSETGV